MKARYTAFYTVAVDIRTDGGQVEAEKIAKDFRRNIDFKGGIRIEVCDDTMTVALTKVVSV